MPDATAETGKDAISAIALRGIVIAQKHQHEMVSLEHMLAALLERPEVQRCFKRLGIDAQELTDRVVAFLAGDTHARATHSPIRTHDYDVVLTRTLAYAQFHPNRVLDGLDVLLQLIQLPHEDNFAVALLLRAGVDTFKLMRYIAHSATTRAARVDHNEYSNEAEPTDKASAVSYIRRYCTDLNEMARLGKIDPVIGRLSEVQRIIQITARRRKNNVALVGDAGVGKTSIVEGLAYKIQQGDVPNVLRGCTIWSLDVAALVAGTRFRGDFEERMKFLLKAFALTAADAPILFIDEIHTIMDAGSGNKGSLDVSNLLKPVLARGDLRCIGSTTDKDWRQHFEKDRALLRRFKKLVINEPSIADAKLILHGLADAYGTYHGVRYTPAALDAAVELTARYVHDGRLPDKAIDVIDEAGAQQRIADQDKQTVIDVAAIEAEVARVAKIPRQEINKDESVRLECLESNLLANVFGQEGAIRTLVNAVLISRAGLADPTKPEGCFLFIGPSGVGKTELARQLASTLGRPLVKFDMSEYLERHSVAKLIGSPPGYVGFGEGGAGDGLLVNAIDGNPACVLLLDEIEKAHPDVFNLLLQVMDDARLTNSAGKPVSFRSVILIMTSNLGVAQTEKPSIGFIGTENPEIDEQAVRDAFSPEFRNRLDAVVKFCSLDRINVAKVVLRFLAEMQQLVSERNVSIHITDAAQHWLVEHGHDPVYGARPLRRLIAEKIKQPLSRLILFGDLRHGGTACIDVADGSIVVTTDSHTRVT